MNTTTLAEFLAEVVLTSHYLAEPSKRTTSLLNDAEMRALKITYSIGPLSMHQLADAMHTSKPRATQLVDILVNRSLVTKVKGGDKRVTYVSLTPKGKKAVKEMRLKYEALADAITLKLGSENTQTLTTLLGQITPLHKLTID